MTVSSRLKVELKLLKGTVPDRISKTIFKNEIPITTVCVSTGKLPIRDPLLPHCRLGNHQNGNTSLNLNIVC